MSFSLKPLYIIKQVSLRGKKLLQQTREGIKVLALRKCSKEIFGKVMEKSWNYSLGGGHSGNAEPRTYLRANIKFGYLGKELMCGCGFEAIRRTPALTQSCTHTDTHTHTRTHTRTHGAITCYSRGIELMCQLHQSAPWRIFHFTTVFSLWWNFNTSIFFFFLFHISESYPPPSESADVS